MANEAMAYPSDRALSRLFGSGTVFEVQPPWTGCVTSGSAAAFSCRVGCLAVGDEIFIGVILGCPYVVTDFKIYILYIFSIIFSCRDKYLLTKFYLNISMCDLVLKDLL